MTWVATAIIAGSAISAGASVAGSRAASNASQRGTDQTVAENARQYDQTRADFAPQRAAGVSALDQLSRLYGWAPPSQAAATEAAGQPVTIGDSQLPAGTTTRAAGNGWYDVLLADGTSVGVLRPGGSNGQFVSNGAQIPANNTPNTVAQAPAATGTPDLTAFTQSPDYQYRLDQGNKALDRYQSSRGRFLSGAGVREGIRYASGEASTEFGNFTQRLMQIAGLGNSATQSTTQAGQFATANNSNAIMQNANNRATGYMNTAQGVNNAVQGGISNFMLNRYLQQAPVK